ncbi:MAG: GNAT family N-acetyltransferase [Pseudomonadota bacterium]
MSAALHLADLGDLDRLDPLVAAYHAVEGIDSDANHRRAALTPLLEGSPLGCVYMIGPQRSPVGYIALSFGWSIEFGGMDGFIDEFFIRETVRGRGMGSEVLARLLPELDAAGIRALHLEMDVNRTRLERLYIKAGFKLRDGYHLMTRTSRTQRA